MPCMGCGKNVERIIVKLRFIGRPNGKLVRGAPGNYKQGEITRGPLTWVKVHPQVWELVESAPELKIPEASERDSVFEEPVFIPDDEKLSEADLGDGSGRPTKDRVWPPPNFQTQGTEAGEITLSGSMNAALDAHTQEVINGYKKQGMYLLDADEGILVAPDESEEKDSRSRDKLKEILDSAGVKYSKHARTETLAQMVKELESKEDG